MRRQPGLGPYFSWKTVPKEAFAHEVLQRAGRSGERPRLVAIDGRGGSGKTQLAQLLASCLPSSTVIHTDDVAWHHSFFDWGETIRKNLLEPLKKGGSARYRPPGWESHGRPGFIEVPSGLDLVIVEGTGSGRRSLASLFDLVVWADCDLVVWADCDPEQCRLRCLRRDGGSPEAVRFFEKWDAQERDFLNRDRPWERAELVVDTGSTLPYDPGSEIVVRMQTG